MESNILLIMDDANSRKEDCSKIPVCQLKLQLFSDFENRAKEFQIGKSNISKRATVTSHHPLGLHLKR